MSNPTISLLNSSSEHHLSKNFSDSLSMRQKSAPPTGSCGRSSKHNNKRTVYNVLIAYRDAICTKGAPTDCISKVYSSSSNISIFQQEYERAGHYPRSRPSTSNTMNSDTVTTNSLSRETSQSSVRTIQRCQRSRNTRSRHHQQESISDVEEDEVGKAIIHHY